MLDPENNLVDILYPGDTVKFLVSTDKDAYIAIIGIDAKGNQYSLPVKDNFLKADMPRTFPDDDVDYQVVDGVFGSETSFYLCSLNFRRSAETGQRGSLSAQYRLECRAQYGCRCQAEEVGNRRLCDPVHGDEKVMGNYYILRVKYCV